MGGIGLENTLDYPLSNLKTGVKMRKHPKEIQPLRNHTSVRGMVYPEY